MHRAMDDDGDPREAHALAHDGGEADPIVRTTFVRPLVRWLRARGIDANAILGRWSLPADADDRPVVMAPHSRVHGFVNDVATTLDDPLLGHHLALAMHRGVYGAFEYIARNALTPRMIYENAARYVALVTDAVRIWVERGDGETTVGLTPNHGAIPQLDIFATTCGINVGRQALGVHWAPRSVSFITPKPSRGIRELEDFFGTRHICFSQTWTGFVVDDAILDRPSSSGDPELLSVLSRSAEDEIARTPSVGFVDQVRSAIRDRLRDGAPKLETVAVSLGLGPRTLQRRLSEAAVPFQALVDDTRKSLALELLDAPEVVLGEVAFTLGFAQISAFHRAFRRWTGTTPARYRAQRPRRHVRETPS